MYDDVLLPTDGSPGSEAAIDHAVHVARQNDAVIHAVHVVEVMDTDDVADGRDADLAAERPELLDPIHDAAEEAGVEVVDAILEGRPHDELVGYVEEEDVDLVVVGTHGKKGLSRVLLGSTAEKVVRHSPAPVLTVREREE